jgi:ABC-2 type transport system permease protein
MSLRRVGILLGKDLLRGPRNFIIIMAIALPIILSLLISLLFGTLFTDKANFGIVDEGNSRVPSLAMQVESLATQEFETELELEEAVARGAIDVGIVLPANFDDKISEREPTEITAYIWGESALKHRAVLRSTFVSLSRQVAGYEPPVEIVTTVLGEVQTLPWEQRLLPFIILMTIMFGGMMIPATAISQERQDRTLTAVTVTPTSLGDVLTSKALLGVIVSVAMAIMTLAINRAFGGQPLLLVFALTMGAIMASIFGLILGIFAKDLNSLFGTIKSMGILLYAPALIYMFPDIPQWIARVFPTYYIIWPIVEIVQEGATLSDVLPELAVLLSLILLLAGGLSLLVKRRMPATV